MQQQKVFQDEIFRLRESLNQPTQTIQSNQLNKQNQPTQPTQPTQSNSELIQQYQVKLSELDQYKQINTKLQDRIIELQNQIQNNTNLSNQISDDPKVAQLQKVKEETMDQIQKLKKVQEDIAQKVNINKDLEVNIKKIISENISKFENSEETIFITSQSTILPSTLKNVTSIELKELDLPFDKYNINSNNNKLHFSLKTSGSEININDENNINDSDTANAIDSEMEGLIDIVKQNNSIELHIIMGSYTIETLVNLINQHLGKFGIKMSYNKTSNLITFKSKNNFDIIFGANTLLYSLGFNNQNQSKYINSNKYTGTKAFDFKVDRCMNIFISNINESKPVMQYITNQIQSGQPQSKKIIFTPVISELSELNLKFTDSKNKEFKFDPDNGLEFGIQAVVRFINSNQNIIKNESNDISSDDMFSIVKQSISIK